ncbi:uncharacterized mitochondrial protein AtMg00810-like [Andrographis paniculata]|uniref:uncharacterized mitochondrial protein AtMg00810-like n=1 Tax=Andrographis paniculata TaxID=175694 RepID=UPI0021E863B3|nr:uncharacterized mitochondrial protein AtMg00810-like [Andrographis paniculata]
MTPPTPPNSIPVEASDRPQTSSLDSDSIGVPGPVISRRSHRLFIIGFSCIKNVFLHDDLSEDVNMTLPPSFPPSSKSYLQQHFDTKSLGHLRYFLSLEISYGPNGFYKSQTKYAFDILSRDGLTDCKTALTPLDTECHLTPMNETLLDDDSLHRQFLENLIYLTITYPNTAYVLYLAS